MGSGDENVKFDGGLLTFLNIPNFFSKFLKVVSFASAIYEISSFSTNSDMDCIFEVRNH